MNKYDRAWENFFKKSVLLPVLLPREPLRKPLLKIDVYNEDGLEKKAQKNSEGFWKKILNNPFSSLKLCGAFEKNPKITLCY